MKKLIAVLVLAVVIVGAAYWLSGMVKPSYTPPNTTNENEGTPDTTTAAPVSKGPLSIVTNAAGEKYLADKAGMTLYVNLNDKGTDGKIATTCNAACEKNWPPFLLGATDAAPGQSSDPILSKLNLFKRADNKMQFAMGTQALYYYAGDKAAGDMAGALVSGWAVAKP